MKLPSKGSLVVMSERTNLIVELPLDRPPANRAEQRQLYDTALAKAKEMVGPGRVLGVAKAYMATHAITSQPTLIFNFAVEAPEKLQKATLN